MKGKKRFLDLTEAQREELSHGFENGKKATFRKRCHFILLSDQGYSIEDISKLYGTTRQSVASWYNRYEQFGIRGLDTQRGQGRKPILRIENELESEKVEQLVEQYAQNLNPVLNELEKEFGKKMSKRTLQRFLKKKGIGGNGSAGLPPGSLTP